MRIAEVVGHFPFLRGAAVRRTETAVDTGRSPNTVAAPNVGPVARRDKNGRASRTVRPDVAAVGAGVIVQLNVRAERSLDRGVLPGGPIVVHADDGVSAALDDS